MKANKLEHNTTPVEFEVEFEFEVGWTVFFSLEVLDLKYLQTKWWNYSGLHKALLCSIQGTIHKQTYQTHKGGLVAYKLDKNTEKMTWDKLE